MKEVIRAQTLYLGDCLQVMPSLPDSSVNLIFADLPYGKLKNCAWDVIIPAQELRQQWDRLLAPRSVIVLTSVFPFTAYLMDHLWAWFRHDLIYEKANGTAPALCKTELLRCHEHILVFAKTKRFTYNPAPEHKSVMGPYKRDCKRGVKGHATQKPTALLKDLIAMYSRPNDVVLDPTMGAGTTLIACEAMGRVGIGIEKDPKFFAMAKERLTQQFVQQEFRLHSH